MISSCSNAKVRAEAKGLTPEQAKSSNVSQVRGVLLMVVSVVWVMIIKRIIMMKMNEEDRINDS